jgi:hypothetical protein
MQDPEQMEDEIGPYYSWRSEPRSISALIRDARLRFSATIGAASSIFLFWYLLPLCIIAAVIALLNPPLSSKALQLVLTGSTGLLLIVAGMGLKEIAWGGTDSRVPLNEIFERIRPYFLPVMIIELLRTLLNLGVNLECYPTRDHILACIITYVVGIVISSRIFAMTFEVQFEAQTILHSLRTSWMLTAPPQWFLSFRRIFGIMLIKVAADYLLYWPAIRIVYLIRSLAFHLSKSAVNPSIIFPYIVLVGIIMGLSFILILYLFIEVYIDLRVRRGEWEPPVANDASDIAVIPES